MLTMLLCDDSGKQIILLKKAILEYQLRKEQELFDIHTALTSTDALQCMSSHVINVAILDVEIDQRTGIDIARELLEKNAKCKIMFVTNYDSFAYSAYEIEAFSYLLKPFEERKLWQQIDKMLLDIQKEQLLKRYGGEKLEMRFRGTTTTVLLEEILYIEKKGKNVVVVTSDSEYEYTDNLKDLEKRLTGKFIRCHNGFIVNLNRITSYKRTEVYVGEEEIGIPVSKANIAKVVKSLEQRIWENAI